MLKSLCLWMALCNSVSGTATVVDGDTIVVEKVSVRLQGIDAQEMDTREGKLAYGFMADISKGHIVCKLNGERTHGRYVGVCYSSSGFDLGAQMVRHGYALDCARFSQGRYRSLEPIGARAKLKQAPYC